MIRRLELSVTPSPPDFWGAEGMSRLNQPMANDLVNHDGNEAPSENPEGLDSGRFWVGEYMEVLGE